MKRKKFFISAGTGLFGVIMLKTFPFNLFNSNLIKGNDPLIKEKVRINPLAVSRKKIGEKNA
jgi:hypothetical protein